MIKKNLTQSGFTLIELLLYMGLFSIMILLITEVFLSVLDVQLESKATSSVEEDGRYILARLFYDIARSSSVEIPASPGDQSNSLQISVNGINYTYSLSGDNLELVNDLGTNALNSYDTFVSNVSFTKIGSSLGKPTVKIAYTVSSRVSKKSGLESKIFRTTVSLR